ncbi:hypothetical protein NLU13_8910 [Sarocladium strictum]|uniref:Uncharacterized protein n=1 Tax=Sarocladium strictum TaxID=5046 RepID=A0AA39G9R3_SARSR|nr:hypothetical protein NLU13_8910 [Sarocladium strictum]
MKITSVYLAALAMTPLAAAAPQSQRKGDDVLTNLFKVEGDDWLQAIKEEAARQETGGDKSIQARGNGKYKVHAMYTDNMINVGDMNYFAVLWQRMYDVSDDEGGLSDTTTGAWHQFCQAPGADANVQARFILDGQWGAVNGVSGWNMRDALIHSMWETARTIGTTGSNAYTVYSDCSGWTWQEGVPNSPSAACGPVARVQCPQNSDCPMHGMECEGSKPGAWLPSIMRINVYNPDGSLRADAYQARISSELTGSQGCDKLTRIAGAVAGFLPGAGQFFAAGISVQCILRG